MWAGSEITCQKKATYFVLSSVTKKIIYLTLTPGPHLERVEELIQRRILGIHDEHVEPGRCIQVGAWTFLQRAIYPILFQQLVNVVCNKFRLNRDRALLVVAPAQFLNELRMQEELRLMKQQVDEMNGQFTC
jgi:hypothetical protein